MFLDLAERYGIGTGMADDLTPGLADALSHRHDGGPDLQTQVLMQIRDNLSAINRKQDVIGSELKDIGGRVIRLEERDARIERLEQGHERLDGKVDMLLREKDQRDGAGKVFVGIKGWVPVVIAIAAAIGSVFSAVYLFGRSAGVIHAPPSQVSAPHDGR